MNNLFNRLRVTLLLLTLLLCLTGAQAQGRSKALDVSFRVSGHLRYNDQKISIGNEVYDNSIGSAVMGDDVSVFSIKGWDHFTAFIGPKNNGDNNTRKGSIQIDRQEVWSHEFQQGDAAVAVDIPLTGARSMAIISGEGIVIAEAKLTIGKPVPSNLISQLVTSLIDARTAARAANDTATVDLIDKRFKFMNIEVNETAGAISWQFKL